MQGDRAHRIVDGLSGNHDHASPGKITQAIKKPKKPTMIRIKPNTVIGMLCLCIRLAEPLALNFLIRGPKLIKIPKEKKPATACKRPTAPKSGTPNLVTNQPSACQPQAAAMTQAMSPEQWPE
tara:strand:- start:576 stop:944 length:369 start_codon:yes stop_codon:yes gene_type:complete